MEVNYAEAAALTGIEGSGERETTGWRTGIPSQQTRGYGLEGRERRATERDVPFEGSDDGEATGWRSDAMKCQPRNSLKEAMKERLQVGGFGIVHVLSVAAGAKEAMTERLQVGG